MLVLWLHVKWSMFFVFSQVYCIVCISKPLGFRYDVSWLTLQYPTTGRAGRSRIDCKFVCENRNNMFHAEHG